VKQGCKSLHELLWARPRHRFPVNVDEIPLNGIYALFEKGEKGHGGDRIVRVGTHTGCGNLRSRLREHFVTENKDRSIFRKNIGLALLNKAGDHFLSQWEIDLTTRAARETYGSKVDKERLHEVERQVSRFIQVAFSFAVLPISDKEDRRYFESAMISTISMCKECRPSKSWMGNHSTKERIRESGLWQIQGLYKTPLSRQDIDRLRTVE